MTAIDRLAELCRRWGGDLVILPSSSFAELDRDSKHPHGRHAIDWAKRRVFADKHFINAGAICHEMAHVFVEDGPPNWHTMEWDWLGWEIALAKHVGCYRTWSSQNASYIIGEDYDTSWSECQKLVVAQERIAKAIAWGYVDEQGTPLLVRTSP